MCGYLPNQLSLWDGIICVCICVCVSVAQAHMHELDHLPDIRLCPMMASLIRSYVTSSVQFTSAFLVMLGNVPKENNKEQ